MALGGGEGATTTVGVQYGAAGRLEKVLLAAAVVATVLLLRNGRRVAWVAMPARGQRKSSTGVCEHRDGGASCKNRFAAEDAECAQETNVVAGDGGGMVMVASNAVAQTKKRNKKKENIRRLWVKLQCSVLPMNKLQAIGGHCCCSTVALGGFGGGGRFRHDKRAVFYWERCQREFA